MDPMECARRGDLEFFKTVDVEILRNTVAADAHGNTLLTRAASNGHVDCCEEILKRCPSLLFKKNNSGATALHMAALNSKPNCVKLILGNTTQMENRGDDNLLTAVTNGLKQTALHGAVLEGDLECAKLLIRADSSNMLLRMGNQMADTAMHIAVTKHHLEIVKLLCQSDPSFIYSANNNGHTPLWIAFREALTGDLRAVEIRKLLIEKKPDECNMRTGANNWTLLHQAAYKGDLGTVEDIFRHCPACFGLVDTEGQNFLHLAAKFQQVDIIKYTMSITTLPAGVLNGQDNHGNTPLHIAALKGEPSMVLPLVSDSRVNKMILNKQGNRALDMINFDYDKIKAGVYGLTNQLGEKEIKEQSDFHLVVGALIAAASFSAGTTVPDVYIAKQLSYKVFVVANAFAFLLSLFAVLSHFCAKHLVRLEHVIYQLKVATHCSLGAIFAMVLAFITRSYGVLAVIGELALFICVLGACFFLFACFPLWRVIMQNKPTLHRSRSRSM